MAQIINQVLILDQQEEKEMLIWNAKNHLRQILQFEPNVDLKLLVIKQQTYCQWEFNICNHCPALMTWKWKMNAEQIHNWQDLTDRFSENHFIWQLRRLVKQHQQNECVAKVI